MNDDCITLSCYRGGWHTQTPIHLQSRSNDPRFNPFFPCLHVQKHSNYKLTVLLLTITLDQNKFAEKMLGLQPELIVCFIISRLIFLLQHLSSEVCVYIIPPSFSLFSPLQQHTSWHVKEARRKRVSPTRRGEPHVKEIIWTKKKSRISGACCCCLPRVFSASV